MGYKMQVIEIVRSGNSIPDGFRVCSVCGAIVEESRISDNGYSGKICISCYRNKKNAYQETRKEKKRAEHMKYTYGITSAEYDAMFIRQSGVCATCGRPAKDGKKLVIDHNHATGAVRGLLCDGCNFALGNVKDNPEILSRMIEYLK